MTQACLIAWWQRRISYPRRYSMIDRDPLWHGALVPYRRRMYQPLAQGASYHSRPEGHHTCFSFTAVALNACWLSGRRWADVACHERKV